MSNGLQHHAALRQLHGRYYTKNDGLRNLIDGIFDNGGSWNPVSSSFGRMYHESSSFVHKRESVHDDIIVGVGMARIFMKGLVSAVSSTAEAPLQRVKILLQNQQELIKCGRLSRPYRGILDCSVRIIKTEGVFSLWRGNSVNLIRIFPEQKFSVDTSLLIGVFGLLVAYPFETVQRRMMMTCGEAWKYKNSADALVQIIKNEGILSLYKGYGACLLGMVPMYLVLAGHKKLEKRPFGTISVVIETK